MLCNVTGNMNLPNGQPATGVKFWLIPSVGGVVSGNYAKVATSFRPSQGGAVDFTVESGEYVIRSEHVKDTVVFIPDQASVDLSDILPIDVPSVSVKPWVRRGATFELSCAWVDRYNVAESLDGVTVTAESSSGSPVSVFLDDDLDSGRFSIMIEPQDTEDLPIGVNHVVIWFSRGDDIKTSINIEFSVIEAI